MTKIDRRDGAEPLKKVFENMIEDMGLGHKIKETKVLELVEDLLGKAINKKIEERYIYNQKLFLKTYSAPLKNELFMIKDALLLKIEEAMGEKVIDGIVIH